MKINQTYDKEIICIIAAHIDNIKYDYTSSLCIYLEFYLFGGATCFIKGQNVVQIKFQIKLVHTWPMFVTADAYYESLKKVKTYCKSLFSYYKSVFLLQVGFFLIASRFFLITTPFSYCKSVFFLLQVNFFSYCKSVFFITTQFSLAASQI